MSSSQTNVLPLASAEATGAVMPGEAPKTVAVAQVPSKKNALPEKPTMGELIEFQVTGLLVVFVVLGAITGVSMFISWLIKVFLPNQYYGKAGPRIIPKSVEPAVAAKPVPAAPPVTEVHAAAPDEDLSQEKILVLLTAAAHMVFGPKATVVSFRPISASDTLWSIQGRAAHHFSHKL